MIQPFMNVFKNLLDSREAHLYNLNMFNANATSPKALLTRSHILSTALGVFRERGLEASTMRELAAAAEISLGSAYYYFPSKEAIIQAYYDDVQAEHARRLAAALTENHLDLKDRLRAAFHSKLDILQGDRNLLSALFRYTGDPHHPLSALGEGTRKNREQSMSVFLTALGDERFPDDIRAILPSALWALHMSIILYFVYDDSPNQQRTRRLVDGVLTLIVRILALVKLSVLKPVRGSVLELLRDAGLLPELDSPQALSIQESHP
jgi:AcrR family transcriptional regulator